MTDLEMQQRLAEAMGWTDVRIETMSGTDLHGESVTVHVVKGLRPGYPTGDLRRTCPRPATVDADAALLRSWLVGQGWTLRSIVDSVGASVCLNRYLDSDETIVYGCCYSDEVPDCATRERRALCGAALQAVEVGA